MSNTVDFILLLPFIILSLVSLVLNCFYGVYILAQTVVFRQFMLLGVSLITLLFWTGMSFAAFIVFFESHASESLFIQLVIILYLLTGLVPFWGFRLLDKMCCRSTDNENQSLDQLESLILYS